MQGGSGGAGPRLHFFKTQTDFLFRLVRRRRQFSSGMERGGGDFFPELPCRVLPHMQGGENCAVTRKMWVTPIETIAEILKIYWELNELQIVWSSKTFEVNAIFILEAFYPSQLVTRISSPSPFPPTAWCTCSNLVATQHTHPPPAKKPFELCSQFPTVRTHTHTQKGFSRIFFACENSTEVWDKKVIIMRSQAR